MPNKELTVTFVQAGAEELEAYLLSEILYWQLHAGAGQPRFTLGSLLLGMLKINAMGEAPGNSDELRSVQNRIEKVKFTHRAAWERKAAHEITARIRLWKAYLQDYRQNPDEIAAFYPREVKWRVLIQVLRKEAREAVEHSNILLELDRMVQSNWLPGGFIWEPYLIQAMPAPEYWFLYGKLKP